MMSGSIYSFGTVWFCDIIRYADRHADSGIFLPAALVPGTNARRKGTDSRIDQRM
jgi:hypothetical protein